MRKLLAVGALAIAVTAFSGCFVLREAGWSVDRVKPGDSTKLTIGLQPSGSGDGSTGYFFMTFPNEHSDGIHIVHPVFDAGGVLGNPKNMVRDDVLRQEIIDEDECSGAGPGVDENFPVWRTNHQVNSSAVRKLVDATLKAKTNQSASGGGAFGVLTTGDWADDGDGIPEPSSSSDDEISCNGFATTGFNVKGHQQPMRLGDALRSLGN